LNKTKKTQEKFPVLIKLFSTPKNYSIDPLLILWDSSLTLGMTIDSIGDASEGKRNAIRIPLSFT
jgi:hypothetical protein